MRFAGPFDKRGGLAFDGESGLRHRRGSHAVARLEFEAEVYVFMQRTWATMVGSEEAVGS